MRVIKSIPLLLSSTSGLSELVMDFGVLWKFHEEFTTYVLQV